MAYNTANPPVKVTTGILAKVNTTEATTVGGDIWVYKSADAIATVQAAGYFSNGLQLGMAVDDIVFVFDTNLGRMYPSFITAVTPTPGASPAAGTGTATINNTTTLLAD